MNGRTQQNRRQGQRRGLGRITWVMVFLVSGAALTVGCALVILHMTER